MWIKIERKQKSFESQSITICWISQVLSADRLHFSIDDLVSQALQDVEVIRLEFLKARKLTRKSI